MLIVPYRLLNQLFKRCLRRCYRVTWHRHRLCSDSPPSEMGEIPVRCQVLNELGDNGALRRFAVLWKQPLFICREKVLLRKIVICPDALRLRNKARTKQNHVFQHCCVQFEGGSSVFNELNEMNR